MGARDGNGRTDIHARRDAVGEGRRHHVPPRIERDDLVRIVPLRMRADGLGRRGIGQVGAMVALQVAGGNRQRAIDGIGAGVRANHIAVRRVGQRGNHGSALGRRGRAPVNGLRRLVEPRVRCEDDVV